MLIESVCRMFLARKAVVGWLFHRFQKIYDPYTGATFYFDTDTELSQWTKPKLSS